MMLLRTIVLVFLWCTVHGTEQLHLGIIPWAGWTPALAGKDIGSWQQQDLDVTVTVFPNDDVLRLALEHGEVDLALAMLGNYVGQAIAGKDVVILGETNWSHGGDKVVVQRGVTPTDLRGTTVGVYLDLPSVRFLLDRSLQRYGLDISAVRVTAITDPAALTDAFVANKFGMMVNYDPEALRAVRQADATVVASSATYPGVLPEGFGMLRGRVPPAVLRRFFRGWFAAVQWCDEPSNWDAYASLMRKHAFNQRTTEADLLTMVAAVRIHLPKDAVNRNRAGGGVHDYLRDLHAFLRRDGKVDDQFNMSTLINTTEFVAAINDVLSPAEK